ncbi:hypothetical protein H4Q26_002616 [Puccinia striiformis f. sp. tritici PST-130]|nr:hypothetical protein H4Q26_002616 [Puccinia striiformis f. sp. tritici PST-130]
MLFHTVVWMEIATLVGLALSSPSVEPSESYHQHGLLAKREPGTESIFDAAWGTRYIKMSAKRFVKTITTRNHVLPGQMSHRAGSQHPKEFSLFRSQVQKEGELIAYVQDAGTRPQDPLTDYKCEPQEQRAYCNECLAQ